MLQGHLFSDGFSNSKPTVEKKCHVAQVFEERLWDLARAIFWVPLGTHLGLNVAQDLASL